MKNHIIQKLIYELVS